MTCTDRNRYQSNRITAYEMDDLRKMGAWRDGRWIGVWCSTSNEFHPTSLQLAGIREAAGSGRDDL